MVCYSFCYIGNNGLKNRGNNGNDNNINMDNKVSRNINKNRHRNIIWFNPSFCKLSYINIGKYFLGLISKHFKDDSPLREIIYRNNIKISYFCTNNISKIIDNYNKKLINELDLNNNDNLKHSCNCKIKNECPLGNKCNLGNIVYQANVSAKENDNNDRYYNPLQSFRNPTLRNRTAVSITSIE